MAADILARQVISKQHADWNVTITHSKQHTIALQSVNNLHSVDTWWRHQMETFSALLAICAGNSPVPGEFPTQRPVTLWALMFTLICARINGWVNNREAGDLRRYRAHYDVVVMIMWLTIRRFRWYCRGLDSKRFPCCLTKLFKHDSWLAANQSEAMLENHCYRTWTLTRILFSSRHMFFEAPWT